MLYLLQSAFQRYGFTIFDKLMTRKHTKPGKKLMGHTGQRSRKNHDFINLDRESTSPEPPDSLAIHENCVTIGS